jgi:hypothetical protein
VVCQFAEVLQKNFLGVSFSFFFDNFFTSAKLMSEMRRRGMKATGTVRVNRMNNCQLPDKRPMMKRSSSSFESVVDKDYC